jgi:hypothetical protein
MVPPLMTKWVYIIRHFYPLGSRPGHKITAGKHHELGTAVRSIRPLLVWPIRTLINQGSLTGSYVHADKLL